MARTFEAVEVTDVPHQDDVYDAFQAWREGFQDSETPGMIRAFRLPMDEQGKPSLTSTGQVRLGSWPVDQYDFDTLCDKILREYMLPTENVMAVRLIGTLTGKTGVRFNKIVTLQRPNNSMALISGPPGSKDNFADILRAMQESNERILKMMSPGPAGGGSQDQLMQTVAMMRALNEPMMQMMGPMMAALAGRPASAGGSSMKEAIETMVLLDRFMGRRSPVSGSGGGSSSTTVEIIKAVSGIAAPLLQLANKNAEAQAVQRRRPQPKPVPSPTATPTPAPGPTGSTLETAPAQPVDLPMDRPSSLPPGSLSQGHNVDTPSSQLGDPAMFAETKKQIDALVDVARGGADPAAVADLFFEQTMLTLDDANYGQLANLIESNAFLGTIGLYNSQVKDFAEFFTTMRSRLVERITAEDHDSQA